MTGKKNKRKPQRAPKANAARTTRDYPRDGSAAVSTRITYWQGARLRHTCQRRWCVGSRQMSTEDKWSSRASRWLQEQSCTCESERSRRISLPDHEGLSRETVRSHLVRSCHEPREWPGSSSCRRRSCSQCHSQRRSTAPGSEGLSWPSRKHRPDSSQVGCHTYA